METQQQINELQTHQLELLAIMARSDDHAAKCIKTGLLFREAYPDDYAAYEAANAEYNTNERVLTELLAARETPQMEYNCSILIDAI